jgi:hypothetical protein
VHLVVVVVKGMMLHSSHSHIRCVTQITYQKKKIQKKEKKLV